MKQETTTSRRAVLTRVFGVAAGAAVIAPTSWTKPVIDSVLIPAHATTTTVGTGLSFDGGVLASAASETRTPSGGTSIDALSALTIAGCITAPSQTITCTATADLGGTTVNLGSGSVVSGTSGDFSVDINVPASSVAPTTAIVSITVTCTAAGETEQMVIPAAAISTALAGGTATATCT